VWTGMRPEVEVAWDRVVIINKGRIVAIDTTQNLTKQLKGGERVHIQVKGSAENLRDSVAAIEGVRNVEIKSNENSLVTADIESESGTDLRPQIASRVITKGFDLLELRSINLSLEDIFMQLTTEEKAEEKAEVKVEEKVEEKAEEVEEKAEEAAAP